MSLLVTYIRPTMKNSALLRETTDGNMQKKCSISATAKRNFQDYLPKTVTQSTAKMTALRREWVPENSFSIIDFSNSNLKALLLHSGHGLRPTHSRPTAHMIQVQVRNVLSWYNVNNKYCRSFKRFECQSSCSRHEPWIPEILSGKVTQAAAEMPAP